MAFGLFGSNDGAGRFRVEVLRSYTMGTIPLTLLLFAVVTALVGSAWEDARRARMVKHTEVTEELDIFANAFVDELVVARNNTRLRVDYDRAIARTDATHTALVDALTSLVSTVAPSTPIRKGIALTRAALRTHTRAFDHTDVDSYLALVTEAVGFTLAVHNDAAADSLHGIIESVFVALLQIEDNAYRLLLDNAVRERSFRDADAYAAFNRMGAVHTSVYTVVQSMLTPEHAAMLTSALARQRAILTDVLANVTATMPSTVFSLMPGVALPPSGSVAWSLRRMTELRELGMSEETRSRTELIMLSVGLFLCLVGAVASVVIVMRFSRSVSTARQLAQDFSHSDTTKRLLEAYRDAFMSFDFSRTAHHVLHGSVVEAVFRRVLRLAQQLRRYLPQTMLAGPSLDQPQLRLDSAMVMLEAVTVATIHAEPNLDAEDDEEEVQGLYSDFVDTVQTCANATGGTIHSMVGSCIVVVWNATFPVESSATSAVHAALEIQSELSDCEGFSLISIGISTSSGLLCNIKTHRKKHVSLISEAFEASAALSRLGVVRGMGIVFDEATIAQLPRHGTKGVIYWPLVRFRTTPTAPVPGQQHFVSTVLPDVTAYTTLPTNAVSKRQHAHYEHAFFQYRRQAYTEAVEQLQSYVELFPKDAHAAWLLRFIQKTFLTRRGDLIKPIARFRSAVLLVKTSNMFSRKTKAGAPPVPPKDQLERQRPKS
eukprot:PhM_4_TR5976/c0_g1_i1/m.58571